MGQADTSVPDFRNIMTIKMQIAKLSLFMGLDLKTFEYPITIGLPRK